MQDLINMPFDDVGARITIELEQKYRALNDYVEGQPDDVVLQVRIQQLAISKVLVNIHGKTRLILARAHGNLGESYLDSGYYEQALDHLTSALMMNGELLSTFQETKHFQTHLFTLIGKCHLNAKRHKDSLYYLQKALEMNQKHLGEEHITNALIHQQLAETFTAMRYHDDAISCLQSAWELNQATFGMSSEPTGSIYLEIAKVYAKKRDFKEAINHQRKAMQIYSELETQNLDKIATIATQLSEWHEADGDLEMALQIMRQAEEILEYNMGMHDKKTVKAKRDISLLLLKLNKYDEALQELIRVQDTEKYIFGEMSIQVGRTYKVIGTLYIIKNSLLEAKEYLTKALNIFEQKCALNLARQVKSKLQIVTGNSRVHSKMNDPKRAEMSEDLTPNHSKTTSMTPGDHNSPPMSTKKRRVNSSKRTKKPRVRSAHPINRRSNPHPMKASTPILPGDSSYLGESNSGNKVKIDNYTREI